MTPTERDAIERRVAAVPEWTLRPRNLDVVARVEAGADPLALAEAADPDAFLGWELEPPLDEAGRGLTGPQAAELVRLARDARALLDALAASEADHDRMLRWIAEGGSCPTMATERGAAVLAAYEREDAERFDAAQHNERLVDDADARAMKAEARAARATAARNQAEDTMQTLQEGYQAAHDALDALGVDAPEGANVAQRIAVIGARVAELEAVLAAKEG